MSARSRQGAGNDTLEELKKSSRTVVTLQDGAVSSGFLMLVDEERAEQYSYSYINGGEEERE